jgi:hypothetical protein
MKKNIIYCIQNFLNRNEKISKKKKKIIKNILKLIYKILVKPKIGLLEKNYIESFKYGTNKVLRNENYISLATGNIAKISDFLTEEDKIYITNLGMETILCIEKGRTNPICLQKYISSENGYSDYDKFGCDWSSNKNPLGKNICGESWNQGSCGDCWLMSSYEVSLTSCLIRYLYTNPSNKKLPQTVNISYMNWAGDNTPTINDFLPDGKTSQIYRSLSCEGGLPTKAIQCQSLYGTMSDEYAINNYRNNDNKTIKKNEELTYSNIREKDTFCNINNKVCYNFKNQPSFLPGSENILTNSPLLTKILNTNFEYKWVQTSYSQNDNITLRKNISNSFVCNHLLTVGPIQVMVHMDSFLEGLIPIIDNKIQILNQDKKIIIGKIENDRNIIQINRDKDSFSFLKYDISEDDILILASFENKSQTEFKTIARQIKNISDDRITVYNPFSSTEINMNKSYIILYQKKLTIYKQFFRFPDSQGNYTKDSQPYGFVDTDAFKPKGKNLNHSIKVVGCVKGYDEKKKKINLWVFRNQWGSPYGYSGNIYVKQGTTLDESIYEAVFLSAGDFETKFLKNYNCENNYKMWNNLNKTMYRTTLFGKNLYYSLK